MTKYSRLPVQRRCIAMRGGSLPTDHTYTGQKQDASGLLYYHARYYDPQLGAFISPDTIVPEPGVLFDYNRYMYVRGNPLNMNDPSGHCPAPPEESGPVICFALFIEPESVPAGPFTVHGDGRTFSGDSDPGASRVYIWIQPNGDVVTAQMNPSGYIVPAFGPAEYVLDASVPFAGLRYTGETIHWVEPSEKNT